MPDYEKVVGELLTPKEQGKMLFHKGLCPGACLTTLNTGRSSLPFMNMFIGSQVTERTSYDTYEVMVDNDYVKIEINEPEPEQESLEDTKLSFVDIDDENQKSVKISEFLAKNAIPNNNEADDSNLSKLDEALKNIITESESESESEKDLDETTGSKKDE
jgi:hypothetical protein